MKVKIEKLDDYGKGIAFVDGKVTFVSKTVPGDIVEIDIDTKKKSYNVAKVEKIVKPSLKRVDAFCPFYDECDGCVLQNLTYQDTVLEKKKMVVNYFQKMKMDIKPEVVYSSAEINYRNKITLKIKNGNLGYYKRESHSLVKIDKCMLAKDVINKCTYYIKKINILDGEVVIRANYQNDVIVSIKTLENVVVNELKNVSFIKGIIVNDNLVFGDDYFYEVINDLKFKVSYDAFFQVNLAVAEKLLGIVSSYIEPGDKVLELYSGVGVLSLTAARKKAITMGIEIVDNAVLNARYNASLNNLDADFLLLDAKDVGKIDAGVFDTLILDPPRKGVSISVINLIKEKLPEKIIYISCDYHTLARDLNLIKDSYDIQNFYVCDMFCYTYHVECVCILKIK